MDTRSASSKDVVSRLQDAEEKPMSIFQSVPCSLILLSKSNEVRLNPEKLAKFLDAVVRYRNLNCDWVTREANDPMVLADEFKWGAFEDTMHYTAIQFVKRGCPKGILQSIDVDYCELT